jgi:hypothetical protein
MPFRLAHRRTTVNASRAQGPPPGSRAYRLVSQVLGRRGGVPAARRRSPAQDAWFRLFQPPPFSLLHTRAKVTCYAVPGTARAPPASGRRIGGNAADPVVSRMIADREDGFVPLRPCAVDRHRPAEALRPSQPMAGAGVPGRPRLLLAAAVIARRNAAHAARRSSAPRKWPK